MSKIKIKISQGRHVVKVNDRGSLEVSQVIYVFNPLIGREVELDEREHKYVKDAFKRFMKAQNILKAAHDA